MNHQSRRTLALYTTFTDTRAGVDEGSGFVWGTGVVELCDCERAGVDEGSGFVWGTGGSCAVTVSVLELGRVRGLCGGQEIGRAHV